jgi:hypothetical protein
VLYLAADGPLDGAVRSTALGVPGRLMPHARPWGPFVIQVAGWLGLQLAPVATPAAITSGPGGASSQGPGGRLPSAVA